MTMINYLKTCVDKIFTMQILSWIVKMELCLNRRLVWELLGWKLINLTAYFVKSQSLEVKFLSLEERAIEQEGFENT